MGATNLPTSWDPSNQFAALGRLVRKHAAILVGALLIISLLIPRNIGIPQRALSPISADEFMQALATNRMPLIDLYLREKLDPIARGAHDRPIVVAAALERDWDTVHRLIKAGASPDLADEDGTTILMAAASQGRIDIMRDLLPIVTSVDVPDRNGRGALEHTIIAKNIEAMEFLLPFVPDLGRHGSSLLVAAMDSGDLKMAELVLEHIPPLQEWSSSALRMLDRAIAAEDHARVRLLLQKIGREH